MGACPACRQVTFDQGRCAACGYEEAPAFHLDLDAIEDFVPQQARTGGPEPLPLDALEELVIEPEIEPPIPMLEGLESTAIETRPLRKKEQKTSLKQGAPFVFSTCPSCQSPVPQPNPAFCDACGFKLLAKRKKEEAKEEVTKVCGECGSKNPPDRGMCRSCGARLKSLD